MTKSKMPFGTASKHLVVGLVSVVALVAGASMAVAQTVSVDLTATADTTVYSQFSDVHIQYTQIWASDSRRTLVKFDLPANLAGSTITKADFEMQQERGNAGSVVEVRRVTHDWVDTGTPSLDNSSNPCIAGTEFGATWNDFDCGSPWPGGGGALGDADPTIIASVDAPNLGGSNNLGDIIAWDIKSLAQQWADGTPNFGLLMTTESGTAGFWSSEHMDADEGYANGPLAMPPTLRLEYIGGGGPRPYPDSDFTWSDESGDWNVGGNWDRNSVPGASGGPFSSYHTVTFSDSISGLATVFTNQHVTVNSVTFNNSTNSYTVAGLGSVSLISDTGTPAANPSISVTGTHEFQTTVSLLNSAVADVASGSTLKFNNALNLNGNTLTKTGDGTLNINNVLNASGGSVVGLGGTVSLQQGTIAGNGTIEGDVDNDGGTISPGNSPGILSVSGNYTQGAGGTLEIEIMGTNPGEGGHDQLNVVGSASLDGTLDIQTDAGFTPAVGATPGMIGDKFVIITANSVSGEFSTVNGRHTGGGKFYDVGYNGGDVTLGAFQALGGDADGNRTVDITDFNTLAGSFGNTGVDWTDADFDANDVVDITDFNTLAGNFGPYGGPGDGPGQVPEPSAVVLLTFGAMMVSLSALRRHIRNIST